MTKPMVLSADASFLINLIATGRMSDVLDLASYSFLVVSNTFEEVKRDRALLEELVTQGRVLRVDLDAAATEHYVSAATIVDDGEAAAIALAIVRRVPVATDDRRAADYARSCGVESIGIFDLLRRLEDRFELVELRHILNGIKHSAHFDPPTEHRPWWRRIMGDD